jgi:hypothetical protein
MEKNHLTILPKYICPRNHHFRKVSIYRRSEVLDLVHNLVLEGHAVNGIFLLKLVQVLELSSTGRKVGLVRVDQPGLVHDCKF